MLEQLPEKEPSKLDIIWEHRWGIGGGIVLLFVIIFFLLLFSGRQDCEITSLTDGVIQTCDCRGLTITVKSTTNSREKKTVCLGRVAETYIHKQR